MRKSRFGCSHFMFPADGEILRMEKKVNYYSRLPSRTGAAALLNERRATLVSVHMATMSETATRAPNSALGRLAHHPHHVKVNYKMLLALMLANNTVKCKLRSHAFARPQAKQREREGGSE